MRGALIGGIFISSGQLVKDWLNYLSICFSEGLCCTEIYKLFNYPHFEANLVVEGNILKKMYRFKLLPV